MAAINIRKLEAELWDSADLLRAGYHVGKYISIEKLIERTKSGEIIKIGGGRYTSYTWNREID